MKDVERFMKRTMCAPGSPKFAVIQTENDPLNVWLSTHEIPNNLLWTRIWLLRVITLFIKIRNFSICRFSSESTVRKKWTVRVKRKWSFVSGSSKQVHLMKMIGNNNEITSLKVRKRDGEYNGEMDIKNNKIVIMVIH